MKRAVTILFLLLLFISGSGQMNTGTFGHNTPWMFFHGGNLTSLTTFDVSCPSTDSVRMQTAGYDTDAIRCVVMRSSTAYPTDTTSTTKVYSFPLADTADYNDTITPITVTTDEVQYWRMFCYNAAGSTRNSDTVLVNYNNNPILTCSGITGETYIDSILTVSPWSGYSDAEGDVVDSIHTNWYSQFGTLVQYSDTSYTITAADSSYYVYTYLSMYDDGAVIGDSVLCDSVGPVTRYEVDSTAFDVYVVTSTFRLGETGIVIAEIDTSADPGDTIRFYITGSAQPTADTALNAAIDTSLQVGSSGVVWDSITLNLGQVYWWSGGQDFNISQVIYTTPETPEVLSISSPDSDTLTYSASVFPLSANGTTPDSVCIRWDTASIPTTVTDGYQVYLGDTSSVAGDFFIDMADSLEVYVSVFAGNGGAYASTSWSAALTDSVFIDSTGVPSGSSYCAEFQAVYDAWTTKPNEATADIYNTMVEYFVDSGYWARMDYFWFTAVHTNGANEADLEWVTLEDTAKLTETGAGALIFTALEGYTGDGTNYLATGVNMSTDANHSSLNDMTIAAYNRVDFNPGGDNPYQIAANTYLAIAMEISNGNAYSRINSTSAVSGVSANNSGFWISTRRGETEVELYRNGATFASGSGASSSIPDLDIQILAKEAAAQSVAQISCAFIMDGVTDNEAAGITTIIEGCMDSLGKGIIP